MEYRIETQHLQDLPEIFITKLDLILTARDRSQQVRFPVHQIMIAQHSLVLSSVRDKAQLNEKYFTAQNIPMVDDSCSTIRAALAFMYNSPTRA